MALPETIAAAIDALPDEVKQVIRDRVAIIHENSGVRVEAKRSPPVDLVRPYREKLSKLGWKDPEISGASKNPAQFSLAQVMRPGCVILEADAEKTVIKYPSGSTVIHTRKPLIHVATRAPRAEPQKPD